MVPAVASIPTVSYTHLFGNTEPATVKRFQYGPVALSLFGAAVYASYQPVSYTHLKTVPFWLTKIGELIPIGFICS